METKLKKFNVADLKRKIRKEYGTISKLKKYLKETANFEYGGYTNEVIIDGIKIIYTDNKNCWATFLVTLNSVGFTRSFALGKSAITKAGIGRGVEPQLNYNYI